MDDLDLNEVLVSAGKAVGTHKKGDKVSHTTQKVTEAVLPHVLEAAGVPGPIAKPLGKILAPLSMPVQIAKHFEKKGGGSSSDNTPSA